jgi:hypothetical protein
MRTLFTLPYEGTLKTMAAMQIGILFITSMIMDGGELFRMSAIAAAAYWSGVLIVMFRRRFSLTDTDVYLLKFGFYYSFCAVLVFRTVIAVAFHFLWP